MWLRSSHVLSESVTRSCSHGMVQRATEHWIWTIGHRRNRMTRAWASSRSNLLRTLAVTCSHHRSCDTFLYHFDSWIILSNQARSTSLAGVGMHVKKDNIRKVPGNNRFSVNINYCGNKERAPTAAWQLRHSGERCYSECRG